MIFLHCQIFLKPPVLGLIHFTNLFSGNFTLLNVLTCFFPSAPLGCEIHCHLLQMILNPDKSDRSKASPVSLLRACRDRGLWQEWWHVPETVWLLQQPNELWVVLMSFLIAVISLWFLTFVAHPDARRRFSLLITYLRQWIQNTNTLYNTRCSSGHRQALLCQSFLICFPPLNEWAPSGFSSANTVWWKESFRQVLLCGTLWRACDGGCSDLILNHHVLCLHLYFLKALLTNLINFSVLLICLFEKLQLKGI